MLAWLLNLDFAASDQQVGDYTISGNVITFYVSSTPQPGDVLIADYRY